MVTIRAVTARDSKIVSAYLGQLRGLFKEFGTEMGGRAPPASLWICTWKQHARS